MSGVKRGISNFLASLTFELVDSKSAVMTANVFEETEGIELLRVIDTNMKLHGVELQFENRSVDTPEDLEFVRNAIIADQLFHKYKHKGES